MIGCRTVLLFISSTYVSVGELALPIPRAAAAAAAPPLASCEPVMRVWTVVVDSYVFGQTRPATSAAAVQPTTMPPTTFLRWSMMSLRRPKSMDSSFSKVFSPIYACDDSRYDAFNARSSGRVCERRRGRPCAPSSAFRGRIHSARDTGPCSSPARCRASAR